jgi:hypothetical protein
MPAPKWPLAQRMEIRGKIAKEYTTTPGITIRVLQKKYNISYGLVHKLLDEAGVTKKQQRGCAF